MFLTCFDSTTFLQNRVLKWRRYHVFPAKMKLVLHALNVVLWENLVLLVVLALESKGLYYFLVEFLSRKTYHLGNWNKEKSAWTRLVARPADRLACLIVTGRQEIRYLYVLSLIAWQGCYFWGQDCVIEFLRDNFNVWGKVYLLDATYLLSHVVINYRSFSSGMGAHEEKRCATPRYVFDIKRI